MTSTYEYIQDHTSHTSTYKYIAAESLRDMLVESLVRGCTSWSKTIATPLIPAVKVRAKALSMGSFPKSAPMFHWLFAWSKDCIFHGPQHSLLACLEVHLQHHVCSTAMFVKQLWKNVMGSCSPPRCKRANPICCIDPRSGALFGQSMALDGLHKVRKAGAPGMGP